MLIHKIPLLIQLHIKIVRYSHISLSDLAQLMGYFIMFISTSRPSFELLRAKSRSPRDFTAKYRSHIDRRTWYHRSNFYEDGSRHRPNGAKKGEQVREKKKRSKCERGSGEE